MILQVALLANLLAAVHAGTLTDPDAIDSVYEVSNRESDLGCCPHGFYSEIGSGGLGDVKFVQQRRNKICLDDRNNLHKVHEDMNRCDMYGRTEWFTDKYSFAKDQTEADAETKAKGKTWDLMGAFDTYTAVVKTIQATTTTEGIKGFGAQDELRVQLSCESSDGKEREDSKANYPNSQFYKDYNWIEPKNWWTFDAGNKLEHTFTDDFPHCGVATVQCNAQENLRVKLTEVDLDLGVLAGDNNDQGVGKVLYDVVALQLPTSSISINIVLEGGSGVWDTFWGTFFSVVGEVCITDFLPTPKVGKAMKMSANTIKRLQKLEKFMEKVEKVKDTAEKAAIYVDVAQCEEYGWSPEDCNARGCDFSADKCKIAETSFYSVAQDVWKLQCYAPEDGEYGVTVMFLPGSPEENGLGLRKPHPFCPYLNPRDGAHQGDRIFTENAPYWIDCQRCGDGNAYHGFCKDGPSSKPRFPGFTSDDLWDKGTVYNKDPITWAWKDVWSGVGKTSLDARFICKDSSGNEATQTSGVSDKSNELVEASFAVMQALTGPGKLASVVFVSILVAVL